MQTPILVSRLRVASVQLVVAGLLALGAVAGPLANTTASARDGAAIGAVSAHVSGSDCPWLNQSLPVGKRVNMLLSHMSLTDKIAEMYIDEPTTTGPYAGYEGYRAGPAGPVHPGAR